MEPINELTKRIFTNYLRDLCVKLDESSLSKIRSSVSKETPNSWCGLIPDPDLLRGALGYFLVSHKCPEYFLINTVDMTNRRFEDDVKSLSELVTFSGTLIIKHSSACIRNKLMLETLLYVISERGYKRRNTIVVSDTPLDKGEHIYYSQAEVLKHIPYEIRIESDSAKTSLISSRLKSVKSTASKTSARPLANMKHKTARNEQLSNRAACIEEGAGGAV